MIIILDWSSLERDAISWTTSILFLKFQCRITIIKILHFSLLEKQKISKSPQLKIQNKRKNPILYPNKLTIFIGSRGVLLYIIGWFSRNKRQQRKRIQEFVGFSSCHFQVLTIFTCLLNTTPMLHNGNRNCYSLHRPTVQKFKSVVSLQKGLPGYTLIQLPLIFCTSNIYDQLDKYNQGIKQKRCYKYLWQLIHVSTDKLSTLMADL
jgi:hypothetical protein